MTAAPKRRLLSLAPRHWAALFFVSGALTLMSYTWRAENAESLAKVNEEIRAAKRTAVAGSRAQDQYRAWAQARNARIAKMSGQQWRALRQSTRPRDKELVAAAVLDRQRGEVLVRNLEELLKALRKLHELEPRRAELEKLDVPRRLVLIAASALTAGTALVWCLLLGGGRRPLPVVPETCRTSRAALWYRGWRSAWAVFWTGLPLWLGVRAAFLYEPPPDFFVCNHDIDFSLPTSRSFAYLCAAAAMVAAAFLPGRTARLFPEPGGAHRMGWPWRVLHRLAQEKWRRLATERELLELSGFLASALEQGLPLNEAVRRFAGGIPTAWRRDLFLELAGRLEAGTRLSEALEARPDCFPAEYSALVRAGEEQDDVARAFQLACEALGQDLALGDGGVAALLYATSVTVVGLFIAVFTVVFVVPTFGNIYSSFGLDLPWTTRALIGLSRLMRISLLPGGAVILLAGLWVRRSGTSLGRLLCEAIPPVRAIRRDIREARFSRVLARLLSAGCGMDRALALAKSLDKDPRFQGAVEAVMAGIKGGGRLSAALGAAGGFSGNLVWACALGEERGDLPETLLWLGDYNQLRVRAKLERLLPLVERSANVAMGVLVGFFLLATMSPIFSLAALAAP